MPLGCNNIKRDSFNKQADLDQPLENIDKNKQADLDQPLENIDKNYVIQKNKFKIAIYNNNNKKEIIAISCSDVFQGNLKYFCVEAKTGNTLAMPFIPRGTTIELIDLNTNQVIWGQICPTTRSERGDHGCFDEVYSDSIQWDLSYWVSSVGMVDPKKRSERILMSSLLPVKLINKKREFDELKK